MLVITYDEHGGFFDHVAPPGTRHGRPEFFDENKVDEKTGEKGVGLLPLLHPDGRHFLGPRVPAFVISPLVKSGSVCKDMFDHTSIIKSILLRHRAKIPTQSFTQFGPRVNMINHLGLALDNEEPRNEEPKPLTFVETRPQAGVAERFLALTKSAKTDDTNFHLAMRRAPLPKRQ